MDRVFYFRVKSAVRRRLWQPAKARLGRFVPLGVQDALGWHLESAPHSPRALEKKLWAGHSRYALADLQRILTSRRVTPATRAEAAWSLGRWYAARAEYELALAYALLMRSLDPSQGKEPGQVLLEVDCLNRLARADEARATLEQAIARQGELADYCLAYANVLCAAGAGDEQRLAWLNRLFAANGFAALGLRDGTAPLAIDNLCARKPVAGQDGPQVSVLMPAYNSATTIEKAIRGLLAQSWQNLEIIPVDDCSTDDTWDVLQAFAEQDPRVKPVRHQENTGAYGARLTALEQASGDFITVHDADDWSHPQKIEAQVQVLLEDDSLVACMSAWCRASHNLYINRVGVIPGPNLQRQNESSLMFRRPLVETLGAWDRVRAAADTEFIWRIQAACGKGAIKVVHPQVPLSFSLSQEDSLTQTGPTHVKTIFYGTRRVYREAQTWWHNSAPPTALKMPLQDSERRLPAPPNLLARSPAPREYDLLLVGDFTLAKGVGEYAEGLVRAALQAGYRVALFHWRRYEKPAMRPVRDTYQALAAEGRLDILAAEDALRARCALVCDPMVARHLKDRFPAWQVGALYCVAGHPEGSGFPVGVWSPSQVAAHLAEAFGRPATWVAVSSRDRELLAADANIPAVSAMTLPEPVSPLAASALVVPLQRLVQAVPKAAAVSESVVIFKS